MTPDATRWWVVVEVLGVMSGGFLNLLLGGGFKTFYFSPINGQTSVCIWGENTLNITGRGPPCTMLIHH